MARVAALPEDAADQVNAFFLLALNDDPALQLRQARRISRHASKGITPLDSLHKPRASKPVTRTTKDFIAGKPLATRVRLS